MNILLWILQVLAVLLYSASGYMKLFMFDNRPASPMKLSIQRNAFAVILSRVTTLPVAQLFRYNMSSCLPLPLICKCSDNSRLGIFTMRYVVKLRQSAAHEHRRDGVADHIKTTENKDGHS